MRSALYPLLIVGAAVLLAILFWPEKAPGVVLYCGVDQDQSRQISDEFEKETGLSVHYQGETEAQRSIGLPQRLLAERKNPRADVFWANEIMAMVDLGHKGLLDPLPEGVAEQFPPEWRDPSKHYVAFGARARILLVNTELLQEEDYPTSVQDLLNPKYERMGFTTCMARPLTGTTKTHAVVLMTRDEVEGKRFLEAVAKAGQGGPVKLAPSNGSAMSLVRKAENKVAFCLTDTDDAWVAIREGDPVKVIYPDQGDGQVGAVVMPNTVALVKGGANPQAASRLLEWLVTAETEVRLARGPSAQIPLRAELADATLPEHVKRPGTDFRAAEVDWQKVGENKDRWGNYLDRLFTSAP